MINEELIKTPMVQSQLRMWNEQGLSTDEIIYKLGNIHLIVITKERLEEELKQNQKIYKETKTTINMKKTIKTTNTRLKNGC